MTNRVNPRTSAKPQPDGFPSLVDIDQRLQNVEQLLLALQAQMLPKYLRVGGWVSIVGSIVGVAIKVVIGH
jgi:hypothetical protein